MKLLCLLVVFGAGCANDKAGDTSSSPRPEPDFDGPSWDALPDEIIGVANWDDDDMDGQPDWEQSGVEGDDDLFSVGFGSGLFADVPDGGALQATLEGSTDSLRVWMDDELILGAETTSVDLPTSAADSAMWVEFDELLTQGTLTLQIVDASGAVTQDHAIALLSAPLILNHHRQPGELALALALSGWGGNDAMVADFNDALPGHFQTFSFKTYNYDAWMQDEVEFGTLMAPEHRMDLVVDSIRINNGSGLDALPESELQGPGMAVHTWGSGRSTSQDSFGNLEVTPPLTVDGVDYPFGRIYWGEWEGKGPTSSLTDMLTAQGVQAPFQLDTSWLCVGHVDEFVTILPDSTAPKGFRVVIANTQMGLDFLDEVGPDFDLPNRYQNIHGYDTVGDLIDDEALRLYNEDIQLELDSSRQILIEQMGLDEGDIIDIPALYEPVDWCDDTALSLIPGTVNLMVYEDDVGTTHLFIADPFFRGDDQEQSDDPFIAEVSPMFPEELEQHWVDDWGMYHVAMGEVHCGTNTQRTPTEDWWEVARDLMGGVR